MNRADHYLKIPPNYGQELGGLRWSPTDAAIEFADGRLFVFKDELALFLSGFDLIRGLIPFGYVLHLMRMLGHGEASEPIEAAPSSTVLVYAYAHGSSPLSEVGLQQQLRNAYRKAGRPIRNAGVLCARLCADIPDEPGEISGRDLSRRLILADNTDWAYSSRTLLSNHEPPLAPAEFQQIIDNALRAYSANDLEHLLQFGSYSLAEEATKVSEIVQVPPTLKDVIAWLEQAPRLASAVGFVPQMVSALAIPPRRWSRDELPLGGYADIATRGRPEQILPGQFALDPDEFTRRFAENELLYFRREEPPTNKRETLVLLLDQGVRTWGIVRSLLGAATLALIKQADRRGCTLRFAATGKNGKLIDPLETTKETLEEVVNASDLSLNPALALETVLESADAEELDIVLLTHPRSLDEPDLKTTVARAGKKTRLFAVAADNEGRVELAELGRGSRRTITKIRIDLTAKQIPIPLPPPAQIGEAVPYVPWTGDVEPFAYPFWFGLIAQPGEMQFSYEGNWIFALGKDRKSLIAARLDGTVKEILPSIVGQFPKSFQWLKLIGVKDGVCLIGADTHKYHITIVHYDCVRRTALRYQVDHKDLAASELFYVVAFHSLVVSPIERLDLTLKKIKPWNLVQHLPAVEPPEHQPTQEYPWIRISEPDRSNMSDLRFVRLDSQSGILHFVQQLALPFRNLKPQLDDRPALENCLLVRATRCGETLLIEYINRSAKKSMYQQMLLHMLDGRHLATFVCKNSHWGPLLSNDGLFVAYSLYGPAVSLMVADVMSGCGPHLRLDRGRCHDSLWYSIQPGSLHVKIGQLEHLVTWNSGTLIVETVTEELKRPKSFSRPAKKQKNAREWGQCVICPSSSARLGRSGIKSFAISSLGAFADGLGHICLFREKRLLCAFFFFRRTFAAWMPDGSRWGPAYLIDGAPTPKALEKIGTVLAQAEEEARTQ